MNANRQAVMAQVAKARARANAAVSGNSRAVLDFFRSGNAALIPENITLAETKAAAEAAREEDFALAGFYPARLPGLRAVVLALGACDIPSALECLAGKRAGASWAKNDAAGVLARLGILR